MGITLTLSLLLLGWAEVSTFIYISNEIGGVLTLLGIFITAFVGIVLLKNQGLSVLKRIRSNMLEGRASVSSVADSISLVIGGILMLIPGYFSDAVGLLLFVPGLRTFFGIFFIKWFTNSRRFNGFENFADTMYKSKHEHRSNTSGKKNSFEEKDVPNHPKTFDDIIEGDFVERISPKPKIKQNKTDQL